MAKKKAKKSSKRMGTISKKKANVCAAIVAAYTKQEAKRKLKNAKQGTRKFGKKVKSVANTGFKKLKKLFK